MTDLSEAKVGDKLFVTTSFHNNGRIVTVDRRTPGGRLITSIGVFNPNGSLRGDVATWGRTFARLATKDDIENIHRFGLVRKIECFRLWGKLSTEDLKAVSDIISKYEKRP